MTRAEALAIGMSPRTLDRRIEDGVLASLGGGVLALPGFLDGDMATLVAAAKGLNAVASHQSAAWIHGFPIGWHLPHSVSVPIRRSNRFPGVVVHQLTDLGAEHVTEIDGLPTTNPSRTVVDLAAVVGRHLLARCVDHALSTALVTLSQMSDDFEALARKGKPGVTKLRSVLESRLALSNVPESALETELLSILQSGDLPIPDLQWRPEWLRRVNGRVDFAYQDHALVLEADSLMWHNTPEAFQIDRERDNLAQLAGWRILRFTWKDVTERPFYVESTVRRALAR